MEPGLVTLAKIVGLLLGRPRILQLALRGLVVGEHGRLLGVGW